LVATRLPVLVYFVEDRVFVFYAAQNFANRMYDMQDAGAQKKVYYPDTDPKIQKRMMQSKRHF
jgi:hypothetical protein